MDEITIAAIARICHQANKAYCETLGDFTQKNWEDTCEEIRESAISGVVFRIKNPKLTSKDQHDNWMKDKIKSGWKYGKIKDEKQKEHPCLMSYHDLPKGQKIKDGLFIGIIDAFI
jgi:hypothetical protein